MTDTAAWLAALRLDQYAEQFERNHIDAALLPKLTDQDLRDLGVQSLGHRKKLLEAITELKRNNHPSQAEVIVESSAPIVETVTAEGERRQVTVMYSDLVGSTALSNVLDPEAYLAIMARYHETAVRAIQRFDGYVQQIQGDGIVAYFGYPMAHEGEADRAIRAGLTIVEDLAKVDVGPQGPLQVRIGIASGLVVMSHVFSPEKSAVGETPNMAQRMQTVGKPGEVMVSDRAKALAGGGFDYEDRGTHELKGIAGQTRVWKVRGLSDAGSRFEAATRGQLTPMVGREQEIGLLLERWELARAGEGQLVLLCGEPGIGKSRMLQAFREKIEGELSALAPTPTLPRTLGVQGREVNEAVQVDHSAFAANSELPPPSRAARGRVGVGVLTALQYQCSPYYTNTALYPIIDHFERALNFRRQDNAQQNLDKLEQRLLTELGRSRTECQLIGEMLSLPSEERYGKLNLSPQRQKDDTLHTLAEIMAAVAKQQPALVLFEDIHWADPTTLEALTLLIDRAETLPLLVLLTYRPEFQPPWTARAHVTPVTLTRLSRAQSASIVQRVAGNKPLPTDLVSQIVDKTDGVPLFLEELTKAVLESDMLIDKGDRYDYSGSVNRISIPATLHDSLMARLDRLIPVKEVAQVGAALGREFSYELLSAVAPMQEPELSEALNRLVQSELVFRRGTPPNHTYVFKHALVQDAAYDSLLKSKRQQLHARIAEAIRQRLPSKAESEPELLAHHYTEAGMLDEAIPLWKRAGELAQQRVALREAIGHYDRALELISTMAPSADRDSREFDVRTHLGNAWIGLAGWAHAKVAEHFEAAWKLDGALDRGESTVRALWGLWAHRNTTGRARRALAYADAALQMATQQRSESVRLMANWALVTGHYFLGEFTQSIEHADQIFSDYDAVRDYQLANHHSNDPKTASLVFKAISQWRLGYPDQARATAELAIAHARSRAHPFDLCWAMHFLVTQMLCARGNRAEVEQLLNEVDRVTAEQRLPYFEHVLNPLGRVYQHTLTDDHEAIVSMFRDIVFPGWDAAGMRIDLPQFKAITANSLAHLGKVDEALTLIQEALDQIAWPDGQERHWLAEVLRIKALVLRERSDGSAAQEAFQQSLAVAREQQAKSWELRTAISYAQQLAGLGQRSKAKELLAPVYAWFTEGFDTTDLIEANALLQELD